MNVFLAGKMDEEHGRWRDAFLPKEYSSGVARPAWALYKLESSDDWDGSVDVNSILPWPIKLSAVRQRYNYVGPYRQVLLYENESKYSGYFHGVSAYGSHGQMSSDGMCQVAINCRRALDLADMVFAYINTEDAYGTIADIAYAFARGKFVSLVISNDFGWMQFEYVEQFSHYQNILDRFDDHPNQILRGIFQEACIEYFTWKERQEIPASEGPNRRVRTELQNIVKWSADPRVRKSVENLLGRL